MSTYIQTPGLNPGDQCPIEASYYPFINLSVATSQSPCVSHYLGRGCQFPLFATLTNPVATPQRTAVAYSNCRVWDGRDISDSFAWTQGRPDNFNSWAVVWSGRKSMGDCGGGLGGACDLLHWRNWSSSYVVALRTATTA